MKKENFYIDVYLKRQKRKRELKYENKNQLKNEI